MIVIWRLKDATWLDGNVAFFTIVVAVIGSSLVEASDGGQRRVCPMWIPRRTKSDALLRLRQGLPEDVQSKVMNLSAALYNW